MTVYSAINQIPSPELTDIPNAQTAFQAVANVLDGLLVPRFASTALRDAYIPSPAEGMVCYVTGENVIEVYDGTRWVKQAQLRYGIGSTSSTAGITAEAVVFTIPSVTFLNGYGYRLTHGGQFSNSANDYSVCNWRKGTISGTIYTTHNLYAPSFGNQVHVEMFVYNSTGADITTDLLWTCGSHSGSSVYAASASHPRFAVVEMVMKASDMATMGIGTALS